MQSSNFEQRLKAASDSLFGKFCAGLAKIDPTTAAVCATALCSATYIAGFGMEISHQTQILGEAGKEALKAYQALTPDTTLRYLGQALSGDLPSTGQNLQGAAAWMFMTVPAATAAIAKLAKGFGQIRAQAADDSTPRLRGATRVEQLQSTLSNLNSSLDKPIAIQEPTASKKFRGLS